MLVQILIFLLPLIGYTCSIDGALAVLINKSGNTFIELPT
jgi:hypothetical protein